MTRAWTFDQVYELSKSYQAACVLAAAAELDLFEALADGPLPATDIAQQLEADLRGMTMLLDALVALELLEKHDERYRSPPELPRLLGQEGTGSLLAMVRHQANCQRRWVQLARAVKTGRPVERPVSPRGEAADETAFIEAMDNICAPIADAVVQQIVPADFAHLLDIGRASGTWTIAFLRANPEARATLFDLPHVIPLADKRLADAGLRGRVELVAGDFMADPLPSGADLAWLSAIVHQNSRPQNRQLFAAIHQALLAGGQLLIRDLLMSETTTSFRGCALFAIHMLLATDGGGTFTFDQLREDLQTAGFAKAKILRADEGMNSVVQATGRVESGA